MRTWLVGAGVSLFAAGVLTAGVLAQDAGEGAGEGAGSGDGAVERIIQAVGGAGTQIGVSVTDPAADSSERGATVSSVRPESPAATAGVREGDIITAFDGERVRGARQLSRLVAETPAGRAVDITVTRDGQTMNLEVTPERVERGFASRWDAPRVQPPLLRGPGPHFRFDRRDGPRGDEWFDLHREFAGPGRGRLGIVAQPLTGQLAEYFGTKDGVLVSSVREDSPAARAGLRAGDVITSVDGEPVESPSALARAAAQAKEGELTIAYVRDRKSAEAKVRLPARERREGSRPV